MDGESKLRLPFGSQLGNPAYSKGKEMTLLLMISQNVPR